jgi:hypothetical protein
MSRGALGIGIGVPFLRWGGGGGIGEDTQTIIDAWTVANQALTPGFSPNAPVLSNIITNIQGTGPNNSINLEPYCQLLGVFDPRVATRQSGTNYMVPLIGPDFTTVLPSGHTSVVSDANGVRAGYSDAMLHNWRGKLYEDTSGGDFFDAKNYFTVDSIKYDTTGAESFHFGWEDGYQINTSLDYDRRISLTWWYAYNCGYGIKLRLSPDVEEAGKNTYVGICGMRFESDAGDEENISARRGPNLFYFRGVIYINGSGSRVLAHFPASLINDGNFHTVVITLENGVVANALPENSQGLFRVLVDGVEVCNTPLENNESNNGFIPYAFTHWPSGRVHTPLNGYGKVQAFAVWGPTTQTGTLPSGTAEAWHNVLANMGQTSLVAPVANVVPEYSYRLPHHSAILDASVKNFADSVESIGIENFRHSILFGRTQNITGDGDNNNWPDSTTSFRVPLVSCCNSEHQSSENLRSAYWSAIGDDVAKPYRGKQLPFPTDFNYPGLVGFGGGGWAQGMAELPFAPMDAAKPIGPGTFLIEGGATTFNQYDAGIIFGAGSFASERLTNAYQPRGSPTYDRTRISGDDHEFVFAAYVAFPAAWKDDSVYHYFWGVGRGDTSTAGAVFAYLRSSGGVNTIAVLDGSSGSDTLLATAVLTDEELWGITAPKKLVFRLRTSVTSCSIEWDGSDVTSSSPNFLLGWNNDIYINRLTLGNILYAGTWFPDSAPADNSASGAGTFFGQAHCLVIDKTKVATFLAAMDAVQSAAGDFPAANFALSAPPDLGTGYSDPTGGGSTALVEVLIDELNGTTSHIGDGTDLTPLIETLEAFTADLNVGSGSVIKAMRHENGWPQDGSLVNTVTWEVEGIRSDGASGYASRDNAGTIDVLPPDGEAIGMVAGFWMEELTNAHNLTYIATNGGALTSGGQATASFGFQLLPSTGTIRGVATETSAGGNKAQNQSGAKVGGYNSAVIRYRNDGGGTRVVEVTSNEGTVGTVTGVNTNVGTEMLVASEYYSLGNVETNPLAYRAFLRNPTLAQAQSIEKILNAFAGNATAGLGTPSRSAPQSVALEDALVSITANEEVIKSGNVTMSWEMTVPATLTTDSVIWNIGGALAGTAVYYDHTSGELRFFVVDSVDGVNEADVVVAVPVADIPRGIPMRYTMSLDLNVGGTSTLKVWLGGHLLGSDSDTGLEEWTNFAHRGTYGFDRNTARFPNYGVPETWSGEFTLNSNWKMWEQTLTPNF